MQVLLRTASTLARQCAEAAQRIELRPITRVSVNQSNLTERLNAAQQTTESAVRDVLELYATRGEIRRLIGNANQEAVHALLVERDVINTTEKVLSDLIEQSTIASGTSLGAVERRRRAYLGDEPTSGRVPHDAAEIASALDVVRQRIATVTSGTVVDYVEVPSLPIDQVKQLQERLASLRRRRTTLSDELAAANLKVSITLSPEVERVLRKHQIIE
jgi:hypothetical protein